MTHQDRAGFRQRYWDEVLCAYLGDVRLIKKSKRCLNYMKALYFGEPFNPLEKSIQPVLARKDFRTFLLLMPEQNETNWSEFFEAIREPWGFETFDTLEARFSPMSFEIAQDPMRYGWNGDADLEYFKFWWGDCYDPEHYRFMGTSHSHPIAASDVSRNVAIGIGMVLQGVKSNNSKHVQLYEYWKSALRFTDCRIYDPESNYADECFHQYGDHERRRLREMKCCLARILRYINHKDVATKIFEENRFKTNADQLRLCFYGMEELSSDEFWSLTSLASLREQFLRDLGSGALPESILDLNRWAQHPDADIENLHWATGGQREYKDPWNPKAPRKKKAESKQKPIPDNTIAGVIPAGMLDTLESLRQELQKASVPTRYENIVDEKSVETMLKSRGYTGKGAIHRLQEFASSPDRYDYLDLLIPELFFEIWREPFAGFEESEVSSVFAGIWKDVKKVTSVHCSIDSIRTRKKKIDDGVFNVSVTLNAQQKKLTYEYKVVDSEIDDSIYTDIVDFANEVGLPWSFHFDKIYSESEVLVFYLPEDTAGIFLLG